MREVGLHAPGLETDFAAMNESLPTRARLTEQVLCWLVDSPPFFRCTFVHKAAYAFHKQSAFPPLLGGLARFLLFF